MATLNPYLNFQGRAQEAMEFYRSVFGGELTRSTFAEFGMSDDPADAELTMHAQLVTPSGFTLMGSDIPRAMDHARGTNDFSVSLSGGAAEEAELTGYYEKLSASGTVGMPLEKAPWGDSFGACTDRFGISWLVNIAGS